MGIDLDGLKPVGVYGEDVRAPVGVRVRDATALEHRRLSAQPEFIFFLPYIPLVVCPEMPDPVAEYACSQNIELTLVRWSLDYQLVPKLSNPDLSTANIFGLERRVGLAMLNFANGFLLEDQKRKLVLRLFVGSVDMIEPSVSVARPSEKLLAMTLKVYYFGVQTPSCSIGLAASQRDKTCRVIQDRNGDPGLWRAMAVFWNGESGRII